MKRILVTACVLALLASVAAAPVGASTPSARETAAGATELVAPTPDWYTAELHERVVAAGARGESVPLPEGVRLQASALAFTGIRPGSWILFPAGCTANFVFGSAADYYIGTAGHCAQVGQAVTIVAAPGVLMNIGTTVISVDNGIGDDFALIDVSPQMEQFVNPSMAYFGGPTGSGNPAVGSIVEHAGHGLVIGTGGTPRAGVVTYRGAGDAAGSDAFGWDGAAAPGDSGSPVRLANGLAAGDLTHLVVGGKYVPAVIAGTTIARMVAIAGRPLATAPNLPDPLF